MMRIRIRIHNTSSANGSSVKSVVVVLVQCRVLHSRLRYRYRKDRKQIKSVVRCMRHFNLFRIRIQNLHIHNTVYHDCNCAKSKNIHIYGLEHSRPQAVLRIRIRIRIRISMFLGLLDPDPDPLSEAWIRILLSSSKNNNKNLDSYCFVTSFWLFIFTNDVNVPAKSEKQKNLFIKIIFLLASWRSMTKIGGSGSGPTPKCHGSAPLTSSQSNDNWVWQKVDFWETPRYM